MPPADKLVAVVVDQVLALWPWEAIAVVLAIAYLVLAIRQSAWCWAAGIGSTLVYLVLCFDARLYSEAVLQLFYIGVSVYGWIHWARPAAPARVGSWPPRRHAQALAAVTVLAAVNGALLQAWTPAALPYLDAFVAWASVLATWMVARKLIENWAWWFVIDAVSIGIYARRGLWLTAALFALYLVLIVRGFAAWRRDRPARPA